MFKILVLVSFVFIALANPQTTNAITVPIQDVDFDKDQRISILDLSIMAGSFTQEDPRYDLDGDNKVSILDLTIAASWFGKSYSVSFSQVPIVTSGLGITTSFVIAPDGRIFVAEKSGSLRVIKNGALLSTPFLTVPVSTTSERGLIGVVLDPGFDSNGYVYIHYTTSSSPHGRVSRFQALNDVSTGIETILIELDTASTSGNHNGGELQFGNDGKLYIHTGDASSGSNAPSLNTTHGKILRINSDGTIPTDNPFYSSTSGHHQAIYAIGLRNPFTGAVDPLTGNHYINDVGENTWEEINVLAAGADYGWPTCEGTCTASGKTNPIYQYNHTVGRAITGSAFYREFPGNYDGYYFGDYTADWIKRLNGSSASTFATGDGPVDFSVGGNKLYWLSLFGRVYRIDSTVTVN